MSITCKLDLEIHVQVSTDMLLNCCLMMLEVFISLSVAFFWPPVHKMYLHDFCREFWLFWVRLVIFSFRDKGDSICICMQYHLKNCIVCSPGFGPISKILSQRRFGWWAEYEGLSWARIFCCSRDDDGLCMAWLCLIKTKVDYMSGVVTAANSYFLSKIILLQYFCGCF